MSEDIVEEFDTPEEAKTYFLDGSSHSSDSDHQTTYYQEREWPEYHEFPNKDFIG